MEKAAEQLQMCVLRISLNKYGTLQDQIYIGKMKVFELQKICKKKGFKRFI